MTQPEIVPSPDADELHVRRTREDWLLDAVEQLRPRFKAVGMPLPEMIRVSVGFGLGSKAENKVILGQTWATWAAEDKVSQVFISPEMGDAARVLDVLIHELVHVADDNHSGHKGAFAKAAKALGLVGKMTATTAGEELADEMFMLATELGAYPHSALRTRGATRPRPPKPGEVPEVAGPNPTSGPAPQGTRMLKVSCPEDGYTVRTTAKWLAMGAPSCPCGTVMEQA